MDGSAQGRLCSGMRQLLVADCAQLVNQSFLEEQICAVGLADLKERSPGVYGPATLRCIVAEGGLAQQPEQLASALVHLSRLRIRSYLELGIFSGFTSTLISTYLRRFAPPSSQFHGLAVDVTLQYLSRETRALLHHNSVTAELRRRPLHLAAASRHEHLDLCFIDGDHHARGVLDDFIEFAPSCRLCMFHDIVDFDVAMMTADEGVPRFWASATANLPSSAYVEFVQQPGRYPASLGLGLILRPELALARAQPWETNSTKPMLYQKVRASIPVIDYFGAERRRAHGRGR